MRKPRKRGRILQMKMVLRTRTMYSFQFQHLMLMMRKTLMILVLDSLMHPQNCRKPRWLPIMLSILKKSLREPTLMNKIRFLLQRQYRENRKEANLKEACRKQKSLQTWWLKLPWYVIIICTSSSSRSLWVSVWASRYYWDEAILYCYYPSFSRL